MLFRFGTLSDLPVMHVVTGSKKLLVAGAGCIMYDEDHIEPDPSEEWKEIELDSRKFRISSLERIQLTNGEITQALAFCPKEEGKEYVNHIDGIPINDNASNLEWCTRKENTQHGIRLGLGYQRQIFVDGSFREFP
ncbi:unnamed protein product [Rhizophagus irregularis]|nr:unnamed protein product [Rhizophagus irregularis]